MKKAIILLILSATAAVGAQHDLRYLQENASGKIVERAITLTPGTFLSVNGSGQLQVQTSSAFRTAVGLGNVDNVSAASLRDRSTHTGTQPWSTITGTPTTLAGYGITDAQPLDSELTAISGLAANGLIARTGPTTAAARTLTAPPAGITITAGDGVAGNPTIGLANDLAAVEGLSASGFAVRSGTDTWATRTITGTAGQITVANGDGVSGNPTISVGANVVTTNTAQSITGPKTFDFATPGFVNVATAADGFVGFELRNRISGVDRRWNMAIRDSVDGNPLRFDHNNGTAWITNVLTLSPSGQVTAGYSLSVLGNSSFGDAAGDDFAASDDDPRFPNLSAATYAAANDPTVAINGLVGDARYSRQVIVGTTSDFSIASNTTFSNVPGLSVAVAAGETWVFNVVINGRSNAAAAGIRFAAAFPTAAWTRITGALTLPANAVLPLNIVAITSGAQITARDSGVEDALLTAQITISFTASGNFTIQAAQNTSNATASAVNRGSTIIANRL